MTTGADALAAAPSLPATAYGRPGAIWGALTSVYILWGSTYLGMAIVVEALPPLLSSASRFLMAGALLAAVLAIRRGPRSLLIAPRLLLGAATIGILLLGCGNGTVVMAVRYVPSSIAALIVSGVPLWIVLIRFIARERPAALTWAGVACGFLGVIGLVVATGSQDPLPGDGYVDVPGWQVALWLCAMLMGSMCWSVGSFFAPRLVAADRAPQDPFTAVVWQFLIAAAAFAAFGLIRGESIQPFFHMSAKTALAWAFIVFGGLVAYTCFVWLLQNAPVSLATTYAYVNPVVAVFLGWLILSEPVTWALLGVGAFVITGVALVVRGERTPVSGQPEPTP